MHATGKYKYVASQYLAVTVFVTAIKVGLEGVTIFDNNMSREPITGLYSS